MLDTQIVEESQDAAGTARRRNRVLEVRSVTRTNRTPFPKRSRLDIHITAMLA
jgi:hypothetical protein